MAVRHRVYSHLIESADTADGKLLPHTTFPTVIDSQKSASVLYKLVTSFAILFSIVLVAGLWHLGENDFVACGVFGAVLIQLGSRPSAAHAGLSLAAGVAMAFLYAKLGGPIHPTTFSFFSSAGAFLGLGSIAVMSLDLVWTGSRQYASALRDALVFPVFYLVASLCMEFANSASHPSYDFLLYRFDSSLGLAPGRAVVSLFRKAPWLRTASAVTYGAILVFPALYHGWACYKRKAAKINLMYTFVIAGASGFVLYQICPAMGPSYAFGSQFPDQLPTMNAVPLQTFMSTGVNNAMPSLHITWALLVWVAAWDLGWFAVSLASIFVTFTGLATLGLGEHYLIDLIVAAPLVMMVHGISTNRHKLTVIGLALVVAWTFYLRTGIQLPAALNWLAIIATMGITVAMMRWSLATRSRLLRID